MLFFSVHSYASAVWCFPLHGSIIIKRHPGNMQSEMYTLDTGVISYSGMSKGIFLVGM